MLNSSYDRWLVDDCCCNNSSSAVSPDCDKDCSCESIYLEIDNMHTDINVVSGEVVNKLDISAYTPVSLSGYATEQWVLDKHYISGVDLSDYALKSEIPVVPTSNTAFTNDAGYLTEHQPLKTINGQVISGSGNIVIEASGGSVTVDDHMDSASTNPVENKVIVEALNDKLDASAYTPTDLSNYYNKQEVNNLIPTVPSNVSAFLNDAHYVTNAELVQYIVNLQQQISSLISTVSGCCSQTGETLYRWVTMTGENYYWCSGTTKMSMEKEQSSTDGLNWTDVSPETTRSGSTILEEDCEDCGYIPEHFKLLLTKNDDSNYIVYCNGDTEAKTSETHYGIDSTTIKEAVIGDCVTTLGVKLFSYCTSLSSVTIPSGVTYIDTGAFYNCPSLSAVTIPSGVTFIGQETFSGCTNLNSVNIPNGIEDVKANTFSYTNVENITIPDSINRILNKSFDHCANLKNVTIGTGCTIISMAFQYCTNLQNVIINATTPPMLLSSPFADTNDTFIIHVPAASLQTYKSASGWSAFADRIISI